MEEPQPIDLEYHRPWEQSHSFNEVLAEQIRKAPYFLLSVAIHGLALLAVAGMIFLQSNESDAPTIEMVAEAPPPEIEEEEPPEEEVVEEIIEEPVLQETELEEVTEMETLEETGDPDFNSDSPFDSESWNNDIGLGGGAGGKYGNRGGRGGGRRGRGSPTEKAVKDAHVARPSRSEKIANDFQAGWQCDLHETTPGNETAEHPDSKSLRDPDR